MGHPAGKQLEGVLNKYDKAINALGNKSKFDITDSKGNVIGSLTGKEIKAVWNGTSFTVTNQTDFQNGGAGATSGTWRWGSFSGKSRLKPCSDLGVRECRVCTRRGSACGLEYDDIP